MGSHCNRRHKYALITMDAEPNPDCLLFTTKGLFVTSITLTSHDNFLTFLTFLECFSMVLVNKKTILEKT